VETPQQSTWPTTFYLPSIRTSTTTFFQITTNDHRPRALLVVFGAFTSLFCTVGFLNSSGVFIEYYAHEQLSTSSSSTIAWLGAISIFFLYALSPACGALLDVFGPKVNNTSTNDEAVVQDTDRPHNRPWSTPAQLDWSSPS
jgi:hypothetical protein